MTTRDVTASAYKAGTGTGWVDIPVQAVLADQPVTVVACHSCPFELSPRICLAVIGGIDGFWGVVLGVLAYIFKTCL